jgi:hypothetical protein
MILATGHGRRRGPATLGAGRQSKEVAIMRWSFFSLPKTLFSGGFRAIGASGGDQSIRLTGRECGASGRRKSAPKITSTAAGATWPKPQANDRASGDFREQPVDEPGQAGDPSSSPPQDGGPWPGGRGCAARYGLGVEHVDARAAVGFRHVRREYIHRRATLRAPRPAVSGPPSRRPRRDPSAARSARPPLRPCAGRLRTRN